jgi:hypothetical protein
MAKKLTKKKFFADHKWDTKQDWRNTAYRWRQRYAELVELHYGNKKKPKRKKR